MQSGGQYGLSEIKQFAVAGDSPHSFAHPQDASTTLQHTGHLSNPFQQHHLQKQQQVDNHHHHQHYQHQQQQPHQHSRPRHLQEPQPHQQLQQPPLSLPHHNHQKTHPSQQELQAVQRLCMLSDSSEMSSPLAPRPFSSEFRPVVAPRECLGDDDGAAENGERGVGCNRWPREETIALLKVRSEMDTIFRDSALKGPLWEEVSRKLAELGFNRGAKKCKEKFENVHKYYKKMKDGKAGRQDGKSYHLFSELEAFYAANNNNDSGGSSGGTSGAAGAANRTQPHGGNVCLVTSAGAAATKASLVHIPETSSGLTLSSDSFQDDSYEPQQNDEQESTRKRKRKSWSSTKGFFENLAKQLLEQQETLHKKFLETIERRDHESMLREEAFKRQELARLNREQELRAQEHVVAATRDAALVAFLQKVTGQTIQLPQPPTNPTLSSLSDAHADDLEKDNSDINTRRWPKVEVHALIRIRSGMEPRFQEAGPKAQLWEEISASLACMGYIRSAKRCKEKWENINKYFKKTKDSSRKRPDNAKTCPYFHHLETLYQKGILSSPNNKYNKIESQYENLLEHNRDKSQQTQNGNMGTLTTVPAIANASGLASANNIAMVQLCPNHEDATSSDHVLRKVKVNYVLPESSANLSAPSDLSFGMSRRGEGCSGSNKSKMDGFVNEILEMQQQQHQKLLEEYEKMEQTREVTEQERRQQQEIHLVQGQSNLNTQDNSELMALVHKLAGDSSQYRISARVSTG